MYQFTMWPSGNMNGFSSDFYELINLVWHEKSIKIKMWVRSVPPHPFSNLLNKFKWWRPWNKNRKTCYPILSNGLRWTQGSSILCNCVVKHSNKQSIMGDLSCPHNCWFPNFLFIKKGSLPMSVDPQATRWVQTHKIVLLVFSACLCG